MNIIAQIVVFLAIMKPLCTFVSPTIAEIAEVNKAEIILNFRDRLQWQTANGKRVQIRGFLYRDDKGNIILASKPQIKSCCLSKVEERIILFGDIPLNLKTAVTIKGFLKINSDKTPIIEEAAVVKNEPLSAKKLALIAVCVGCLVGLFKILGSKIRRLYTLNSNT